MASLSSAVRSSSGSLMAPIPPRRAYDSWRSTARTGISSIAPAPLAIVKVRIFASPEMRMHTRRESRSAEN